MAPTAVRERELIQPVRQGLADDSDGQFVADRKVRQAKPARRMFLGEEDLAIATMFGAPLSYPTLQGAQHRTIEALRVSKLQFLQHRHRHQARGRLQHWHDLRRPHLRQWVGARAPCPRRLLGGQKNRRFDPARAGHTHPNLGSRHLLAVLAAQFLVLGHLMIRYAFAGQGGCLL
ncbi:hypothetical protein D3C85_1239750 [compost metagenome]